ncbi:WXG100 family type VII secretion target [Streptomyces sp. NBC_00286]|uniref:WXG100 family type VII secretion target n=1 Tax=Streptomyces sp. NBC_00286 TaxID=2975701 RepID=UPI002E293CE5|nr:type VII secretion target [Streptomyces sp. NBC_00286]
MADHVRADLAAIKQCSRDLTKIHGEFERNGNPADEYGQAVGHGGLKDAFSEFGDTWKKTRKKLMKELEQLAEFTRTAAKAYDEIDQELAKAIRDAKAQSKGKK